MLGSFNKLDMTYLPCLLLRLVETVGPSQLQEMFHQLDKHTEILLPATKHYLLKPVTLRSRGEKACPLGRMSIIIGETQVTTA